MSKYRALVLWQRDFDPLENRWASAVTDRIVCVWLVPEECDAGYSESQVRGEIWAAVEQAQSGAPPYNGWDRQGYPQWRVTETEGRLPEDWITVSRWTDD